MCDDLVPPERAHRLDVGIGPGTSSGERHPQCVEFLTGPTDPHAKGQSSPAEKVERRGLFGHDDRVVFGEQQHPGGEPDRGGGRGGEGEGDRRVEPVRFGGNRDLLVGGVRVRRRRVVDHHDMLAAPQCAETTCLGFAGHGVDDVAACPGPDAQRV